MDKKLDVKDLTNDELIKIRNNTEKMKWDHYNKFNNLTEQIKYLESIIYKKCNHNWDFINYKKDCVFCCFKEQLEKINT